MILWVKKEIAMIPWTLKAIEMIPQVMKDDCDYAIILQKWLWWYCTPRKQFWWFCKLHNQSWWYHNLQRRSWWFLESQKIISMKPQYCKSDHNCPGHASQSQVCYLHITGEIEMSTAILQKKLQWYHKSCKDIMKYVSASCNSDWNECLDIMNVIMVWISLAIIIFVRYELQDTIVKNYAHCRSDIKKKMIIVRTIDIAIKNINCNLTHRWIWVQQKLNDHTIFEFRFWKWGCPNLLNLIPMLEKLCYGSMQKTAYCVLVKI